MTRAAHELLRNAAIKSLFQSFRHRRRNRSPVLAACKVEIASLRRDKYYLREYQIRSSAIT